MLAEKAGEAPNRREMKQWDEIRTGFQRPFWVANISEMFERLSYYAVFGVLALYLHNTLKFSNEQAAALTGTFGFVAWFLPIFGGAIVDKVGFRRALSAAYLILSVA
jgi:POT family proton-dependent oligopeptide transporter